MHALGIYEWPRPSITLRFLEALSLSSWMELLIGYGITSWENDVSVDLSYLDEHGMMDNPEADHIPSFWTNYQIPQGPLILSKRSGLGLAVPLIFLLCRRGCGERRTSPLFVLLGKCYSLVLMTRTYHNLRRTNNPHVRKFSNVTSITSLDESYWSSTHSWLGQHGMARKSADCHSPWMIPAKCCSQAPPASILEENAQRASELSIQPIRSFFLDWRPMRCQSWLGMNRVVHRPAYRPTRKIGLCRSPHALATIMGSNYTTRQSNFSLRRRKHWGSY